MSEVVQVFGRRPPQAWLPSCVPASENLHKRRHPSAPAASFIWPIEAGYAVVGGRACADRQSIGYVAWTTDSTAIGVR